MPKPIVCLSEQLRQYLEVFRPCFTRRQWKYFVTVLLGLIECEERKTMTGLLRVVGERISLSGLCASKLAQFPEQVALVGRASGSNLDQPLSRANEGSRTGRTFSPEGRNAQKHWTSQRNRGD
jgi:hypothetical protein